MASNLEKVATKRRTGPQTTPTTVNGTVTNGEANVQKLKMLDIAPALVDLASILGLVLGGCCSNVLAYEKLLLLNPTIGSALTFSQMAFVTVQTLPGFITFPPNSLVPRLKKRQVPLYQWLLQVSVLTLGSLLNNWAYAYKVPLTILIVFRSAGLPISMLFGVLFAKRRYNWRQICSVLVVTAGAFLAALSRTVTSSTASESTQAQDLRLYLIGMAMLLVSLLCTGFLGFLQERTYNKYGPCWKECIFYTHAMGLPSFIFLRSDVRQGLGSLSKPDVSSTIPFLPYIILLANLYSQYVCVSKVNQLSSRVSSVSTNIALTVRKALSLCLSVWWFGNEWNLQLAVGAAMVFIGSLLYTSVSSSSRSSSEKAKDS